MNSSSAVAGTPSRLESAPVTASRSSCRVSLLAARTAFRLICLLALSIAVAGCQPKEAPETSSDKTLAAKVSEVPLRIRVVGELTDPDVLKRRWLAESEQPIEIRIESLEDYLADEENATDVLIFPSHLLGELVQRDWILKLPELPQLLGTSDDDVGGDSGGRATSVAADASSRYGGTQYAVPLGCSVPQFVASSSLVAELSGGDDKRLDPQVDLSTLRNWLQTTYAATGENSSQANVPPAAQPDADSTVIDREALVDRFTALMLQFSERDPRYGLFFDISTLTPRIASEDGLEAVELLRLLLQQEGGGATVFGSHDAAWSWAANHERPVVAMAAVSMLGPETQQIAAGEELRVGSDKYMNVGQGLLVGVSSNCRQTLQSLNFIAWLSRPSTTQVLAPLTRGVDPARPLSIDASAWRLRQNLAEALSSDRLPQEPRFPAAHSFRSLIADALVATLRDGQPAEVALADAEQKWQATATAQEPEQFERAYKTSLGLRSR